MSFLTHKDKFRTNSLFLELSYSSLGHVYDLIVVRSTKTSLTTDHKDRHIVDLPVFNEWCVYVSKLQS